MRGRVATSSVYAAQGFAVAGVYTTLPAAALHFDLSTPAVTAVLVVVMLCAGAGSFVGLAAVRRWGAPVAMRLAVLATGLALLAVAVAPDRAFAVLAYAIFGLALGAIDVSENTAAASLERACGHSIFASFFAFYSGASVVAAVSTSAAIHAGWTVPWVLAAQSCVVLALVPVLLIGRAEVLAPAPDEPEGVAPGLWRALVPLGVVMLVLYVVDSTASAWTTVYLHRDLGASLSIAPLGFAAYQAGTLLGRSVADRVVRRHGSVRVIATCSALVAVSLTGLALAPHWPVGLVAAALVGVGASVLVPMSLAAGGRLRPGGAEAVLARLNVFNYVGVLSGSALGGVLGASGHFRLAYAVPALLVAMLPLLARHFDDRGSAPAAAPPVGVA
jgi:predicted MFS family arabinose efflux permease